MTKRLRRYSSIKEAFEDKDNILLAGNSSIVLKNGKVYTGRVIHLNIEGFVFENMRLKKQKVSASELSELIIDFKEK